MKSVVIIGGGLGGLFCGAMLAKEGFFVQVVEKNVTVGGGLQTFTRFGERFDTGMHTAVGMSHGGTVRRICDYLGITERMRLKDVDPLCSDRIFFADQQQWYEIGNGREGFVDSFAGYFPEERENLTRYVDAVYEMTSHVDVLNLRPSDGGVSLFASSQDFLLPADAFIAKFTDNPTLQSLLAYLSPLYGGRKGCTPAYVHAILTMLYIEGASRFVGGSDRFAELLAGVIREHGGNILTGDGAAWVEVNDRHVDYVLTESNRKLQADYYISAIHPMALFQLMPEKALPPAFVKRVTSIPNSYSAFCLFLKLKPGSFRYLNFSEYYLRGQRDIWCFDQPDRWPVGLMLMTPPEENQGDFASKAIITVPMLFSEVERWKDTRVGRRGDDYLQWKDGKATQVLELVEQMHPGFRSCIERMDTASPLTIRDYYGSWEGALYGFSKDCNNIALSQLPVVTKIRNLFLSGQCCNLHGFCGVPLTAINTCEAILGVNHLITKIGG